MMKSILLSFLFVCPLFIQAQKQHEITTDAFLPLTRHVRFNYEYIPAKRVGIAIGLGYNWDRRYISDNSNPFFGQPTFTQKFSQQFLSTFLAVKFYPFSKKQARGLMIGAYGQGTFETHLDPEYPVAYRERYGRDYPSYINDDVLAAGAIGGFKFIFKDRWLIEPAIAFGIDFVDELNIWTGDLFLNIGYRFSATGKTDQSN